MVRHTLTETERTVLTGALKAATEQYVKDAEVLAKDGLPGYATQFRQQAADALKMYERIEAAEDIIMIAEAE